VSADPWVGVRTVRPWPFAPLLAASREPSGNELGRRLNLSGSTLHTARSQGLTDEQADRWAVRLGLHPAFVWDGWAEAGLTPLDERFLYGAAGCEPGWRQAAIWAETHTETEVAA
jgi:hypothetical protein